MDWLGSDYPFSSTSLAGKHAIVCGASKGIGAATAKMLAKAGARVTAVSRNPHDLVAELEGDEHTGISLDLEDKEAIDNFISTIEECHILINNAAGPPAVPYWTMKSKILKLHSVVICTHHTHWFEA